MIPKEPWEFIQVAQTPDLAEAPEPFTGAYTGVSDPQSGADGVLNLLSDTAQKFSSMEADAKVQDETDQKNYKEDMAAQQIELDNTNMDSQMKTSKKVQDETDQKNYKE